MAKLYGTLVADKIVPTDSQDTFPTHDEEYGLGGFRTVFDLSHRDLISKDRRKEGMLVFCLANQSLYQLIGGVENTNWKKLELGGSKIRRIPFYDTDEIIVEDVKLHPLVSIYVEAPTFKPVLFGEYHFREPIFRQEYEMNEASLISDYSVIFTPASNSLKVVLSKIYSGIIVINE